MSSNMSSTRPPYFSSFTATIIVLLLIVGTVPLLSSIYLFHKISTFNQDLQREADRSISEVSDIYRAWATSESSSLAATRELVRRDVEQFVQDYQITSADQLMDNTEFKEALTERFKRRLSANEFLLDIDLQLDQTPYIHVQSEENQTDLETRQVFASIVLGNEQRQHFVWTNPEEPETEVIDATVIDDDEAADAVALPAKLPKGEPRQRRFHASLELNMTYGYEKSIVESYESLGERRKLHSSITAMEKNETTQMSSMYQKFFIAVLSFEFFLIIIAVFIIVVPLSHRISLLARATARVAEGDLDSTVNVKGNDQIAYLTRQFNAMVSDLKSARDNRAYIERMQAWQEVARKLAHEIKNPLTPMLLAMQQLDKKFDDYRNNPKKYRQLLDDVMDIINEEAATLQKLVKEFSSFARLPEPDRKPMVFFEFVAQTVQQNPQFEEQAKRITVHEPTQEIKQREANIDKELMRRVIVNIIRNGIEAATNAKFEPEIDIKLREKHIEKSSSNALWLSIIDNGPGLTPTQKENLFKPYFTTKSDGTGLGLVIVRKIVQDHNGDITLHDREDGERGTQVDIVLKENV
ncbi:MAG: HAMP domain-containing protein [Proteobacteria bacterium]|jgi:nitrogen fixation/metabolism regulation signal transduction histidine kinase|nr:HAMP domain-containing protein [Pseudomonadota bacterium]